MTPSELAISALPGSLEMLKSHVSDFSEADMLVRPCPGANHTAWQLGHLASAERRLVNAYAGATIGSLPARFEEKFTKETAKLDDPKAFPSKAEILEVLSNSRAGTIAWAKSLKDSDLDRPGPEHLRRFAQTIGQLLVMTPVHTAMHLGQIQVIRRKLGRPVMF